MREMLHWLCFRALKHSQSACGPPVRRRLLKLLLPLVRPAASTQHLFVRAVRAHYHHLIRY